MGWVATATEQRGLHCVLCPIQDTRNCSLESNAEGMARQMKRRPVRHMPNTRDQEQSCSERS
eukprot:12892842-Prorocentrum_lima.AAC.1